MRFELVVRRAHQLDQFVVDELHERLAGSRGSCATSCPSARTRMRSMKSFTTLSATSASSSAVRTSRSASLMFSSVSRALAGNGAQRSRQSLRQIFEHAASLRIYDDAAL